MVDNPWVERSFNHPNIALRCDCGWEGVDADIESWDIQRERDRVVRRCPDCGSPVPEWGTLQPIDGAAQIARGPLQEALHETDSANI
jgi:hypothetical protein